MTEPHVRSTNVWDDYIKMDLKKQHRRAWTGFIWLRIGTGGAHF